MSKTRDIQVPRQGVGECGAVYFIQGDTRSTRIVSHLMVVVTKSKHETMHPGSSTPGSGKCLITFYFLCLFPDFSHFTPITFGTFWALICD